MINLIINFWQKLIQKGTPSSQTYSAPPHNKQHKEGETTMATEASNFTDKEHRLFVETVIERELGIVAAKNVADLRSKTDIFANDSVIEIEKVSNKQGTTKVSVFLVSYEDLEGNDKTAYLPTI